MNDKIILTIIALISSLSCDAKEVISSPGGLLEATFEISDGKPVYSLQFKGQEVVRPSSLGLDIKGQPSLTEGFILKSSDKSSFDETWDVVWGEEEQIRNHYNELFVTLEQPQTDRELGVRFRLYDDGLGFRYEFPQQEGKDYFIITDEKTQFAMTGDHTAYWLPGDYDTQEYDYQVSRLSDIRNLFQNNYIGNVSQTKFSDTVAHP